MARSYGALKVSVWEPGSEFRTLSPLAQWAYALLLSQPQLTNLGTLPYTPERWSRFAAGMTLELLEQAIDELGHGAFVIVDRDTGELLVRTFIKHDKVFEQPRLVTNARRIIHEVESDRIRSYLTMRHPWLLDESTKEAVEKYEADVAETPFDTPSHTPFQANGNKPLSEPLSEPLSIGVSKPLRPRAARVGPGPGPGVGAAAKVQTQALSEAQHETREDEQQPENLAAAQALEAPRPSAIGDVCLEWAADQRQVEPLAQALTAGEFADVVATVRKRVETGNVQNPAGLLMQLLRLAVKQRERRDIGQVTIATPAEQVLADAVDYARGGHPLEVAADLIERKLRRLAVSDDDRSVLLAEAVDAYAEAWAVANEEPDLAPRTDAVT